MALKPNYYETLYVVRPDLTEDELSKIQSKLPEFIAAHDGEIMKSDKWAERALAYEIQDHKRGVFYILIFKALPTVTRDIEKHLRFYNTDVLRFMTVKINEEVAVREKNAAAEKSAAEHAAPETPPAETTETPEAPAKPEAAQPETAQPEAPQETPEEETVAQPEAPEEPAAEETVAQPETPEEPAAEETVAQPETPEEPAAEETVAQPEAPEETPEEAPQEEPQEPEAATGAPSVPGSEEDEEEGGKE